MSVQFKKASKEQAKLRLGLVGPAGSGKTWTALAVASALVPAAKIAVIDTERGSASKYASDFQFDTLELTKFHPVNYIEAIRAAGDAGYHVLIIDSLSHAWMGQGGVLELVDNAAKRSQSGNSFTAWRDVTPLHNQLIDAILSVPLHLIATMRSKTEYVLEPDSRGKMQPRKVGLAPVQRDGMDFEFDVVGDLNHENTFMVSKTRCSALQGAVIEKPGAQLAEVLRDWLTDGVEAHWSKNGGGQRFNARIRELNLQPAFVLASLEPDRALERLTDISLTEEEAFARLEALGQQAHEA